MRWFVLLAGFVLSGVINAQVRSIMVDTIIYSPHYFNSLDEALANPEKVWYLDLSMQKLTSLPEDIGKLKNLKRLDISFNRLTTLPQSLANLKNLEVLDMSGLYNMRKAPEVLKEMTHLKELYLIDNRLPQEEIEKIKQWLPNTKIYLTVEDLEQKQNQGQ